MTSKLLAALLFLGGAYLSGSVNYAIIVTWLVRRRDIRTLGNRNPGTANVARSVGRGWAVVVFAADLAKGLAPLILARRWFLAGGGALDTLLLAAVGLSAIAGHCWPLFFGFRGGGGIATSIGVYAFFVPAEFFMSVLLGFFAVMLFVRGVRFRLGRWTPILFVTITPFLTLALNWTVRLELPAGMALGGHPWYFVATAFAISFFILGMNVPVMGRALRDLRGLPAPEPGEQPGEPRGGVDARSET